MDPFTQFCPNSYCFDRGKTGLGNIRIHSHKERRFRCTTCGKTFAATKNTPYYRLHKPLELVSLVLTLLCYGCPRQAIVAAFGLDERTVADWQQRADQHSRHRDGKLIAAVVRMVRSCARSLAILVCVDGLPSYVTAFVQGFRHQLPNEGRPGRPRLLVEPGLLIGSVIKRYSGRRVVEVTRRVAWGSAAAIAAVLARTGTGAGINTAYIERLNGTFRGRWTPLVRRGRALVRERCVHPSHRRITLRPDPPSPGGPPRTR